MNRNVLKLKVCGMREPGNVSKVAALKPDYMGFIFYPKSPRFVGALPANLIDELKKHEIEPVAVFVNASLASVIQMAELYGFTHVQLHGQEPPQTCQDLREKGLTVLKAFNIADAQDLEILQTYEGSCSYFLFDTKSSLPGGSGCQFDWNVLDGYTGATPFFLSGGISPEDADRVRNFSHPMLYGLDVNSRFEIQPALKDAGLLKDFIDQLTF
jgi:phosphoribosylanthranilate isomerase